MNEFADVLALTARCAVGAVFLAAAASKVMRRSAFEAYRSSVTALAPGPLRGLPRLAEALVAAEFAVVGALVWTPAAGWGLGAAALLLTAFAAAVARARGAAVACNCFGYSPVPAGVPQIVRNAVLASVAVAGLLATAAPAGVVEPAGTVLAVGTGLGLAVICVAWDDLAALLGAAKQ
ncbi:hypothetical protein Val02_29960 [Virgisporangium aliadipatigenens]|uniref:Methylamine utilisation protein MauE domain-containing protein n=1 Tax=Virgisporangium aliadipatigenens TaxID=741659 RepID=A0A8J3YLJ0_9ACTN|nr:MauE/DoxX family redox-associated membrane protein [Virgisporangium aliadipatigenens]GIJ46110.1 hypothetical protein Val02_29960 [Virgisporangium aliadipatigenens]